MANVLKVEKLKFVGIDDWNRAVFKHIVTNEFFCFVDQLYNEGEEQTAINDLMNQNYQLYCKLYGFDSEPDCPVEYDVY